MALVCNGARHLIILNSHLELLQWEYIFVFWQLTSYPLLFPPSFPSLPSLSPPLHVASLRVSPSTQGGEGVHQPPPVDGLRRRRAERSHSEHRAVGGRLQGRGFDPAALRQVSERAERHGEGQVASDKAVVRPETKCLIEYKISVDQPGSQAPYVSSGFRVENLTNGRSGPGPIHKTHKGNVFCNFPLIFSRTLIRRWFSDRGMRKKIMDNCLIDNTIRTEWTLSCVPLVSRVALKKMSIVVDCYGDSEALEWGQELEIHR